MSHHIEIIGFFAGLLGLIAWIPQFQTVWIKRLHQGLDLRTLTIVFTALCVWCVYGYLKQAWAVCISNMVSGSMIISIIARVRHLRRVEHNTCRDTPLITTVPEQNVSHTPAPPADKLLEPEFPWGPRVPPKCPVEKFKDDLSDLEQN